MPCPFINKGGGISPCQHEDTGRQPPFGCHHEDTILGNPYRAIKIQGVLATGLLGHYPFEGHCPEPEEPDKSMSYPIHNPIIHVQILS